MKKTCAQEFDKLFSNTSFPYAKNKRKIAKFEAISDKLLAESQPPEPPPPQDLPETPDTCHQLLCEKPVCTKEEAKRGYRISAMKYHPDKNPGNQDAAAMMVQVNECYEEFKYM
jgi:hypothetical protein